MNENVRKVAYCPHCGNRAPQRLIHKQVYFERVWSVKDGSESKPVPCSMFVAVCETCSYLLIYENFGDQLEENQFHRCSLVFPKAGRLHNAVPDRIADVYEEAHRIKEIAPNAFAVQIRRALEALCEDRGVRHGNLQQRLQDLADKGDIPPMLAEASDALRLLGNIGAHGVGESVHPLLANAVEEFFRAIVEYVYVAPSKLQDFKDQMSRYTKKKKPNNIVQRMLRTADFNVQKHVEGQVLQRVKKGVNSSLLTYQKAALGIGWRPGIAIQHPLY